MLFNDTKLNENDCISKKRRYRIKKRIESPRGVNWKRKFFYFFNEQTKKNRERRPFYYTSIRIGMDIELANNRSAGERNSLSLFPLDTSDETKHQLYQ